MYTSVHRWLANLLCSESVRKRCKARQLFFCVRAGLEVSAPHKKARHALTVLPSLAIYVASLVNQTHFSAGRLSIGDYKRGAYNLQSISALRRNGSGSRDYYVATPDTIAYADAPPNDLASA